MMLLCHSSQRKIQLQLASLVAPAEAAARYLKDQRLSLVKNVSIISPFEQSTNPLTGQAQRVQSGFERYGEYTDGTAKFYSSVPIGLSIVRRGRHQLR